MDLKKHPNFLIVKLWAKCRVTHYPVKLVSSSLSVFKLSINYPNIRKSVLLEESGMSIICSRNKTGPNLVH